ncbi:MAG: NAD(P)-dependent oxidoreductase [Janthinobacterium lividum]
MCLHYDDPEPANAATLSGAHGYQVKPRSELRTPWFPDAALIRLCPDLLAVCSTGAGFDYIDVAACTAAGVIVCNQAGANVEAVAEHTLAFMLALSKRIGLVDKLVRRPAPVDRFALLGNDIRGKTLGLIGIGAIGRRVAALCTGLFGMTVLAYDPYLSEAEIAVRGARQASLSEVLRASDFVSVHCPRTDETMNMLDAEAFAAMRASAYFITTARGGIHNEAALVAALRDCRIAGAGVDVFLEEPPPHDHPLLQFDTVIATPHMAAVTAEALEAMAMAAADQWLAIFAGQAPPCLVNPAAWPAYANRFQAAFGREPDRPG